MHTRRSIGKQPEHITPFDGESLGNSLWNTFVKCEQVASAMQQNGGGRPITLLFGTKKSRAVSHVVAVWLPPITKAGRKRLRLLL